MSGFYRQGRIKLAKLRQKLKNPFIEELGISPIDFNLQKGWQPFKSVEKTYPYDEVDKIFIKIAQKLFLKKWQLKRTFLILYHCYSFQDTHKYLSGLSDNKIELKTITTYYKRIVDAISKEIDASSELSEKITKTIKDEYEKFKNQRSN